jgi:hypothetical protein
VGCVEIEPLGVERPSDPSAHRFVLLMFGVSPGFKEASISRAASDIFRRA